jgi:hypothetical protein
MRTLIAPLTLALALAISPALLAGPALFAEEKKDEKAAEKPPKPLGEVTLNGITFTAALEGEFTLGKEIEIKLVPKGAALPKGTIRGWVGIESAKGSTKGHAHKEDDGVCVHAEVPDPLPADSKIWIQLDTDDGKVKAALGIPK